MVETLYINNGMFTTYQLVIQGFAGPSTVGNGEDPTWVTPDHQSITVVGLVMFGPLKGTTKRIGDWRLKQCDLPIQTLSALSKLNVTWGHGWLNLI